MMDYEAALDAITWYNGLAPVVLTWASLPTDKHGYISCPDNYGLEIYTPDDWFQLQLIWMLAVELFGDCGTSPRYGWIENTEAFRHWCRKITKIYTESDEIDQ